MKRNQVWSKYGEKKVVWKCVNRLKNRIEFCKNSPTISEEGLQETIVNAVNHILNAKE